MKRFLMVPLTVFLSSILVCFAVQCIAAEQPTVLVVAQDGTQLFYHHNGQPIDSEEVPKGTELKIESTAGERCFVTYKGKPAYIRREFLATKQEFLDAQQHATTNASTHSETAPSLESGASTQNQATENGAAATTIGYAWPKNDLLVPDKTPTRFKHVVAWDAYPLVYTTNSGYLIICRAEDGSERIGLLPLYDQLGNSTRRTPLMGEDFGNSLVIFGDVVELQSGAFPLLHNQKYPVLSRDGHNLQLLFAVQNFTQTLSVPETDMKFLSKAEYDKAIQTVIQTLTARGDKAIHGRFSNASEPDVSAG